MTLFFLLLLSSQMFPQSKFLNNVAKDVKNEILGSGNSGKTSKTAKPEPSCACNDAQEIISLSKYNLLYSEINIDMVGDGSFLVQDRLTGKYFIIKDGEKKGPFSDDDPQVSMYLDYSDEDENPLLLRFKDYISQSGNKYTINFNGKIYGPYSRIEQFMIPKSGDKFAAIVVENEITSEDEGEAIEAAMKNAKTDQEKMELAMKFSQQMTQKMMAGGGAESVTPKFVTNIEGTTFNPMMGGLLNASMKYNDIVYTSMADVIDLKGNILISLESEHVGIDNIFINSANTSYAAYGSGTLYFGKNKTMSDLFNPYLVKSGSKIQLAYLYYSPKKDAIMQCKIDF